MKKDNKFINRFVYSIWITFFTLLIAYSVYILIISPELALELKPQSDKIFSYIGFRIIIGIYFFIAMFNILKLKNTMLWLLLIISIGIMSRIVLIPSQPVLEDDFNRYLWDGAVTANFINPYVYSPEQVIDKTNKEVPEKLHQLADESGNIIQNINHPHIRTIYPILSQFAFAAAYLVSPWSYEAWKILLLIFDVLLLIVLIKLLKKLKLPLLFISFYWLNPIVIHEFYNAAHMDLFALLFVMLSLYYYTKDKLWIAVIMLALAAGFKLFPVILLPLLLRKYFRDKIRLLKYTTVFLLLLLVLFLPVLLSSIDESLGFVKYAGKWVNNAAVYNIFSWLIEQIIRTAGIAVSCISCINRWGIIILYLIILYFILKTEPGNHKDFFLKALLIVTVLYIISPTQFPWYYTWIVPLLVIRPMVSILLYSIMLPLYQLNYTSEYIIYIEHIPILILFLLELKFKLWENKFIPLNKPDQLI